MALGLYSLPVSLQRKMFSAVKTFCNHLNCILKRKRMHTPLRILMCIAKLLFSLSTLFFFHTPSAPLCVLSFWLCRTGSTKQTKQTTITSCGKAKHQDYGLKIFCYWIFPFDISESVLNVYYCIKKTKVAKSFFLHLTSSCACSRLRPTNNPM